jgi:hypothetical protein
MMRKLDKELVPPVPVSLASHPKKSQSLVTRGKAFGSGPFTSQSLVTPDKAFGNGRFTGTRMNWLSVAILTILTRASRAEFARNTTLAVTKRILDQFWSLFFKQELSCRLRERRHRCQFATGFLIAQ